MRLCGADHDSDGLPEYRSLLSFRPETLHLARLNSAACPMRVTFFKCAGNTKIPSARWLPCPATPAFQHKNLAALLLLRDLTLGGYVKTSTPPAHKPRLTGLSTPSWLGWDSQPGHRIPKAPAKRLIGELFHGHTAFHDKQPPQALPPGRIPHPRPRG
ncbi:hypothetical protein ARTHRO9AX_30223 [Arthrobacter sp. 9AX]|nr:hypothetical protein ARTHRO9AX_30223 [Arthrobacter sp. 9AX]